MNDDKIEKYEEIQISYINGNKKWVVEQLDTIDIAEFLEYLKEQGDTEAALNLIISYFITKRRQKWIII